MLFRGEQPRTVSISGQGGGSPRLNQFSNIIGPGLTPQSYSPNPSVLNRAYRIENNQFVRGPLFGQTLTPGMGYMVSASSTTSLTTGNARVGSSTAEFQPSDAELQRMNDALGALQEQFERIEQGLPVDQAALRRIEGAWQLSTRQATRADEFTLDVELAQRNGAGSMERSMLALGLASGATDGFDESADQPQTAVVPAVPNGFFAESFGLSQSYRATGQGATWHLEVGSIIEPDGASVGPVEMSWSLSSGSLPSGQSLRLLDDQGNPVVEDMRATQQISFNAPAGGVRRRYQVVLGSGSGPHSLSITADNGSVTRDPDLDSYPDGTQVTLLARPDSRYDFDGWSGALSGSSNPITLTMDASKSVTASFSRGGSGGGGDASLTVNHRPLCCCCRWCSMAGQRQRVARQWRDVHV